MQETSGTQPTASATTDPTLAPNLTRRDMLKMSTAAAVAAAVASGPLASAVYAQGNDTLKYGLIGCGGRGSGAAANALKASSGNKMVAIADLWPDKVDAAVERLGADHEEQMDVPKERRFAGIDGYKGVIEASDVVLLATPPHFRPAHLAAALAAGKHVFCEKPVAVDVPGVKKVLALGDEAKKKNLNLVSGLCYRYEQSKIDTIKKIHEGAIGDVVALQGMYNTGWLWKADRKPEYGDVEWQLRNWLYFTWLSGDHIVEQHVHTLDKMLWIMKDVAPARVTATGGRTQRTDPSYGHIWDNFATVFEWDTDKGPVRAFCQTRQWLNAAVDVSDWAFGTKGTANLMGASITGENAWKRPKDRKPVNMYDAEHIALVKAIRSGKTINDTDYMTKATLMGIMGRMAAYTGQTVHWDKDAAKRAGAVGKDTIVLMDSEEVLGPPSYDLKAKFPVPPVAVPGKQGAAPAAAKEA